MRVTERYPHESWRTRRPTYRTRRSSYNGPLGPAIVRTKDGGDPKRGGRFSRVAAHVAKERAVFYRFRTTPNWAGIAAAHAGAAQLFRFRKSA